VISESVLSAMGRKKSKVRWTSVEGGFFAEDGSTMKIDETQARYFTIIKIIISRCSFFVC